MQTHSVAEQQIETAVDVALNTWAIAVQLSILTVLTVVFLALWSNFPRRDITFWGLAWLFNLLALGCIFLVLAGTGNWSPATLKSIYLMYACGKVWFAILLVIGLGRHLNRVHVFKHHTTRLLVAFTVAVAIALLFSPLNTLHIQIIVYTTVGLIMLLGGLIFLVKQNTHPGMVTQIVLAFGGVVFLHHAAVLIPTLWGEAVPRYMTRISFFDSIAELIVGIACILAVSNRVMAEISSRNAELELVQQKLRELVDEDPLTQLSNRRKLEAFGLQPGAMATLVYIDVDQFKQINDRWGHAVGDLCLKRVAETMRETFGPVADLYRLGGDEFLAIVKNPDDPDMSQSISEFKQALALASENIPAISVSVGVEPMSEHQQLADTLKAADKAMYMAKQGAQVPH